MVENKIMRSIIHPLQQVGAFVNDNSPVAPCKHRRKQTCNLNILPFGKPVWNTNRIVFDESGCVVLGYFAVEEVFEGIQRIIFILS